MCCSFASNSCQNHGEWFQHCLDIVPDTGNSLTHRVMFSCRKKPLVPGGRETCTPLSICIEYVGARANHHSQGKSRSCESGAVCVTSSLARKCATFSLGRGRRPARPLRGLARLKKEEGCAAPQRAKGHILFARCSLKSYLFTRPCMGKNSKIMKILVFEEKQSPNEK